LIALDPANPVLYYQKARAHWELGQTQEMNESWLKASTLGDEDFLAPYAGAWIASMYAEAWLWTIRQNPPRIARALESVEVVLRAGRHDKTAEMADVLWRLGNTHNYFTRD